MTIRPQSPNTGKRKLKEDCPRIELLAAYAEHKLTPEETLVVESHLVNCRACRRIVILTVRNKGLIDDLSLANPIDS